MYSRTDLSLLLGVESKDLFPAFSVRGVKPRVAPITLGRGRVYDINVKIEWNIL